MPWTEPERAWALYTTSTGGTWLSLWWRDDQDTFAHDGVTYTRVGPVVRAYTRERARELIERGLKGDMPCPTS